MRYRALDENGDYTFGQGGANFLANSPACVAQSVNTRLGLWQTTWFLDKSAGMPWLQGVIGKNTGAIYDIAIQQYILATPGVLEINGYSSFLDRETRKLCVTITQLVTIYGTIPFTAIVPVG